MIKYNINNKPFDFPENLNEFQENSTNNNIKISYKENRYKASEKILNEDELIETLKNNDCLFGNSAFVHFCIEKSQIIEEVYNIKLYHLQKSFIVKNDIKSIRTTLHKQFYKDVLNYYKGDEKEILYSYHHFIILEEICRLEEEGKTKEEIKKMIFNTEALSKKEKEYFDIGVEKYNAKDFINAVNYFNNCLEVNKENIEAYKYIAESYYNLKNYDNALENFNKYIELNTNDDEIYNLMGICFYRKENYNESIECFSKCIELNRDNYLYYFNRATAKFENKEFESSIYDFNKCLELNIKDPQKIYFYIAKSNYELNQYDEFAENLNKAIELNFDNEELNFYRGFLNYKEDNFNEAKECFNKSIESKYNTDKCYLYIGIINYKENNSKEALKYLNYCIKINSNNFEAYFYRLKIYYKSNKYEEFRDDLHTIYEHHNSDELNFYKGFLNYKEGNFNEAKEYFNKSIELQYNTDECYLYIGIINYKENNFQEAEKYLNDSIKLNRNNYQSYYFRGCCYYKLYKKDQSDKKAADINALNALEDFDKCLELNSQLGNTYSKRAEIKLYMSIENNDKKMKNEAKEDMQNALKYKTYDSAIIKFLIILDCKADTNYFDNIKINDDDIYYMAVYYFINGNFNKAEEYFIKYLEIKGEDYKEKDKIYYNISVCLYNLDKYAEALEYLEKAIEYDRDNYKYLNTMALMCYRISKYNDYKYFNLTRNTIFEKADKYCNFNFDDYRYYAASFFKFAMNKDIYDEKTKNKILNNYIKKIKKSSEENYYEAYILQGYNDYYSANIIYDDFIYKNSSIINYSIINDGSYSDKLFYYDKSIESKTNDMQIYLEKAKLLFNIREHDEAIKYFNVLLEKGKYKDDCLYYLGLYNYINENYEEAIKKFQSMSNNNIYDNSYLYLSNYELGNYELPDIHYFNNSIKNLFKVKKSEDIEYDDNIKKLLESAPKEISSNKKYADTIAVICYLLEISKSCFYKLGIIKYCNEAIDYCDMLIEESIEKSNNNYFYYIKGAVQYIIFSYDINNTEMEKEAFKNMKKYFEYNIFNIFESNNILRIYYQHNKSYNYKFYMEKGENFIKENDYKNALECFSNSLYILDSDNVKYDIYYNLAVCFCEIGNYKNGINIFEYILNISYKPDLVYNIIKYNFLVYNIIKYNFLVYNIIKYKFKEYNENVCSKEDILKYLNDFESKIPNFKFIIDYYTAKIQYDENKIIDCIENIFGSDNITIEIIYDFIDTLSNISDNDNIQVKKYFYISLFYYILSSKTKDVSYKNKGLEYYEKLFNKTNGEILHRYYKCDINIIIAINIIIDSMEHDYFKMMLDKKFKEKLYNEIISIYNNNIYRRNNIINVYAFKSYYELGEYAKSISVINEIRDTFLNYNNGNNGKIKNAYSYLSYIKLENFAEAYKISRDIDKEAFNDEYLIEKLRDIYKRGTYEQKSRVEKFCSNRNIEL